MKGRGFAMALVPVAMLLGLSANAALAAPSAATRVEIEQLMDRLSTSGCSFQRNGSWHDAVEARAHLQRKYDYLLRKEQVGSTAQFIERAASRSSLSGRAYRVKCEGREQDAASWFKQRLQELREPAAPPR